MTRWSSDINLLTSLTVIINIVERSQQTVVEPRGVLHLTSRRIIRTGCESYELLFFFLPFLEVDILVSYRIVFWVCVLCKFWCWYWYGSMVMVEEKGIATHVQLPTKVPIATRIFCLLWFMRRNKCNASAELRDSLLMLPYIYLYVGSLGLVYLSLRESL